MSRPSSYTDEIADRICGELADGRSLRSICSDDGMPDPATVYRWLRERDGFREQYARAREDQADTLADEIQDIADDARNDWMRANGSEDAGWRENGETIGRSRLRVEARKWVAAKLKPKKYGDKVDLTHGNPDGTPLSGTVIFVNGPSKP